MKGKKTDFFFFFFILQWDISKIQSGIIPIELCEEGGEKSKLSGESSTSSTGRVKSLPPIDFSVVTVKPISWIRSQIDIQPNPDKVNFVHPKTNPNP